MFLLEGRADQSLIYDKPYQFYFCLITDVPPLFAPLENALAMINTAKDLNINNQLLEGLFMIPALEEIFNCVMEGNQELIQIRTHEALEIGIDVDQILQQGLILPMAEVGIRFENGLFFVPEMLISARAMKSGLEIIKPLLVDAAVKPTGKIIIGTVEGDLHDIGKNLVAIMLEGAGFAINDLGVDISPEIFIQAIVNDGADILALSALLTTTMTNIEATIDLLISEGLRDKVKIIVGGAPLTEEYAQKIGADGYASNASKAVAIAKQLLPS